MIHGLTLGVFVALFFVQIVVVVRKPNRIGFVHIAYQIIATAFLAFFYPIEPILAVALSLLLLIPMFVAFHQQLSEKAVSQEMVVEQRQDEWVSMLAHELRSPIAGMIGLADMLIDGTEGELSESVVSNLQLISHNGRRLTHLLSGLLDEKRLKTGEIEMKTSAIHLRSLVNRVLATNNTQASMMGIELLNRVPNDLPNVLADPDKIEQILFNLVGNSLKFTEKGHIYIRAEVKGTKVDITVEDTGKGLSKKNLDEILSKTEDKLIPHSLSSGSTGLGLKIITRLLNLHDSKLVADSTTGIGSNFSFSLPVTALPAQVDTRFEEFSRTIKESAGRMADLVPQRAISTKDKYEIMIVDDETINLRILNAQLNRAGYKVIEFFNGDKALNHLRSGAIPDLVLLDLMMPGMSGFEVLQQIRGMLPQSQLPVILVTAKNRASDILEGFKAGANDYVTKPIEKDELLARIKTHLELSKVHQAFSYFVPIEFLQFLGYKSILDIRLGDQVQKHMTVLFSDIKDFSRISEAMTPKEAFDFINTFLGVVSPVIRENGGFIDKFIGDAIMALFPGSPDDALNAAIRMTHVLKELNVERVEKGLEPIQVGTGLHTGDLMLGTVGEEKRMDGTVISDAVNTASRMEGLTKIFDTSVVISSKVIDELLDKDRYHFKYLGKSKVKGKQELLDVYGVIEGDDETRVEIESRTSDDFEKGIDAFYARNFTGASVHFNDVLKKNPKDKAAALFLKRSANLMISGVPTNWDGIE